MEELPLTFLIPSSWGLAKVPKDIVTLEGETADESATRANERDHHNDGQQDASIRSIGVAHEQGAKKGETPTA